MESLSGHIIHSHITFRVSALAGEPKRSRTTEASRTGVAPGRHEERLEATERRWWRAKTGEGPKSRRLHSLTPQSE